MTRIIWVLMGGILLTGCAAKKKEDPAAGAPPVVEVEKEVNVNDVSVDHPEQFPLVTAAVYTASNELNATGTVNPDVARQIPVVSLAAGRVIETHARLGDYVTKGQLLLKVQSADISQAFSDYQQALADETLAKSQLDRAKLLYDKGAIPMKDVEVAQNVADKARVTVVAVEHRLTVLGADRNKPSAIVDVVAPVSGVITDQQVTNASGVQGLASPNPFTISDLTYVWIICDVYENDLAQVHLGETAEVHLSAYPNRVIKGRVSNIGPVLDPNLRTAKVRLEVANPEGILKIGMFATATFAGSVREKRAAVPATAILHLHDREWAYAPNGQGRFRRMEVIAGKMLPGNLQEVVTGLQAGQQVVANALVLQNTVEQ
jgi:cobalt-zinc-cadmium efflux system membrane fusion protein